MPELPEVETIRRDLTRDILHKTILRVDIIRPKVVRQPAQDFTRRLLNQTVSSIDRRGKALIVRLSSKEHLVVQLMMTGQVVYNKPLNQHTRVAIEFSDRTTLLYNDLRVFGQLRVVKELKELKYFQILGPEPFDKIFNDAYIAPALKKTKRPIKSVLLDHTFVGGIGNIYACEILFRCKINPQRPADRIKPKEIPVLRSEIVSVLKEAITHRGSSMRDYLDGAGEKGGFKKRLKVYAQEKKPCAVCKSPITRIAQAGRSTFYCMKCQK